MTSIAERLRKVIDSRDDVRDVDVARAIGVSKAAMSDILNGKTKQPKPTNLLQIADFLGLEIRWVISGIGPKTRAEARRDSLDLSDLSDGAKVRIQTIVDAFSEPTLPTNSNNQ